MKKALCVPVVLAALAGMAVAGGAAPKDTKAPKADPKELISFTDNMDDLSTQLSLTDEQKKKIQEIREARDKAVERWNKANEKKIAAVEAKMSAEPAKGKPRVSDNVRKQAEAYLNSLYDARNKMAGTYEKKMFALLTPEQRGKYNGQILNDEVTKEFAAMALTDDQGKKILELCEAQGKLTPAPVEADSLDKTTLALKQKVFQKVLTAQQRKEYQDAKRPAKTPTKRTGQNKGAAPE